jgi:acyl-CoA dehydrogenase
VDSPSPRTCSPCSAPCATSPARDRPIAAELDREPRFPWATLQAHGGAWACSGSLTPEADGGAGLDTLSAYVLLEEIAAADAAHATIMSVTNGLPQALLVRYGDDEQRRRYLPRLASGEWIGAFCLTEPHAGSDAVRSARGPSASPAGTA